MANTFDAIFSGISDFKKGATEIQSKVDKASLAAIRANQNKIKTAVRANLRGEPRWTERSGTAHHADGGTFQVPGTTGQKNSPREGGPGRMTGDLYRGVGATKKPRKESGTWVGGVGIGLKINNFKKGILEAKYPYFKPAVDKVMPLLRDTYVTAYNKAIDKQGGF